MAIGFSEARAILQTCRSGRLARRPAPANAEITDLLLSDPTTDWSRVNIVALRQHLIDMEVVTISADVETEQTPQGAVFAVSGNECTLRGIMTMVPTHAPFLEG